MYLAGGLSLADDNTHLSWTAGGGIEQALGAGWSGKTEYLYAEYGSRDYFGGPSGSIDVHTVKLGFNYHFNSGRYWSRR